MNTGDTSEALLLSRARQGDRDAFQSLTEPHRRELFVFSYRLLGSFHDAEDLVQETLLRAWLKLASFAERSSFRAWLYKIATNTGINMLAHISRRLLPSTSVTVDQSDAPVPSMAEPLWLEPLPDAYISDLAPSPEAIFSVQESISLAFMVALQLLPPNQRAVLILRDVLDWHASEVAQLLDLSVAAVNSALQRARATLATHYHPIAIESTPPPVLTVQQQALLARYMHAWETNDVEALVALLREDAIFSMPPQSQWQYGRERIGRFFRLAIFPVPGKREWRLVATSANAQPAYVLYRYDQPTNTFAYFGVLILTLADDAIAAMTAFIDPALRQGYGYPPTIGAGD